MSMTPEEREAGRIFRQAKARERKALKSARPKSPKADRGRERDTGFLQYLRRLPCTVCPAPAPSDAAHIRMASPERGKLPTGMQVKPSDRFAVPMCRACHSSQHSMSEARFWASHGIDPFATADSHFAAYKGPSHD